MSTTPNLLISHIAASQNQKEVTANTALDTLDEALCGKTTIAMSNSDLTLSQQTFTDAWILIFNGITLTADRHVIIPNTNPIVKPFVVSNQCAGGKNLIIKVGSGATQQTIPPDSKYYLLWCDGANAVQAIDPILSQVPMTLKHYTVATLPTTGTEGDVAFATDGLKSFETTGLGTGVPVYFSQSNPSIGPIWRVFRDDSAVQS